MIGVVIGFVSVMALYFKPMWAKFLGPVYALAQGFFVGAISKVYDAAWKHDQGRDIRTEAYMAKIFGDSQSFMAADRCMEIHGGIGMATDLPIEKFWRDQRSMMITEGPIEILKMAMARHVLRTYG